MASRLITAKGGWIFATIVSIVLFLCCPTAEPALVGCDPSAVAAFLVASDGSRLWLQVASTRAQQERGLMFVGELPADRGMLFVFSEPTSLGFWMRDTTVPLSVAWLTADRVVIDVQDMQPLSEDVHRSPRPYRLAVEANRGWFAAHGAHPGDRVELCPANLP